MTRRKWKVEFYEKPNGRRPVEEYLNNLSNEEYDRIDRQMGRLEDFGPELRRPDSDLLRDKIHELRAHWRRVQLRILYWRDGSKFILSHGVRGKSNRIRDFEIDKAIAHRKDYFVRKGEGT
jgi:hypothetical protein